MVLGFLGFLGFHFGTLFLKFLMFLMVFSRFGLVWVYLAKVCSEKINLAELIVEWLKDFLFTIYMGRNALEL